MRPSISPMELTPETCSSESIAELYIHVSCPQEMFNVSSCNGIREANLVTMVAEHGYSRHCRHQDCITEAFGNRFRIASTCLYRRLLRFDERNAPDQPISPSMSPRRVPWTSPTWSSPRSTLPK
ncbi:uncharacterized protein ARMOST_16792 [Armillaria ostoyae]|uniref:Uncharacterized protein n=1 Tax=Armillaria ostoyae TaxID=47428 RepID=A0A284RX74_ARMOS|nr:uncharacterized protein ARMOST_16792 [Armillaria ostoyae]